MLEREKKKRQRRIERGKGRERERDAKRAISPGSAILTICEGLEAHLAAVFAKASHGPRPHLYHVHGTWPEALHARRVGLAPQDGGVNLGVVLRGEREAVRDKLSRKESVKSRTWENTQS